MLIMGLMGMLIPKPALSRVCPRTPFTVNFSYMVGYQANSEYKKVLRFTCLIKGIYRNSHLRDACR